MPSDELHRIYQTLRQALEAAYAARPWNGPRIDRIAQDLLRVERALAAEAPAERLRWNDGSGAPISRPVASGRQARRGHG